MNKFDELLDKLQSLKIEQGSVCWDDDLPDNIYSEYFEEGWTTLAEGLDYERHRWCAYSTSVIQVQGGLLGIHGICDVFGENSPLSEFCSTWSFFRMKEKTVVSYEPCY